MVNTVLLVIFILTQSVVMVNTAFATGSIDVTTLGDAELANEVTKLGLNGIQRTNAATPATPTTVKPSIIKSFVKDIFLFFHRQLGI